MPDVFHIVLGDLAAKFSDLLRNPDDWSNFHAGNKKLRKLAPLRARLWAKLYEVRDDTARAKRAVWHDRKIREEVEKKEPEGDVIMEALRILDMKFEWTSIHAVGALLLSKSVLGWCDHADPEWESRYKIRLCLQIRLCWQF